jgi:iron complex outermembrane receptor protein
VDLIGKFITPYGTLTTVLSYENRNDYDNTYDLSGYGAGAVVPPSWNLLNPATWNYNENAIATVTPYAWTDSHLMVNSYSALAQYSGLNDHLFLLGGLRVDDTKTVFTNKFVQPWVPVPYLQNKTSYQIGALYRINPNLAVYVNSSSSFSPTTQSLVNSNGTPVNPIPIIGTGREAGIKNIVEQILLTSNATSNTYYYIQDGLQRSKGIEYSATASLNKNIDLIAGYTYLTANDIDDPASPINQGERLGQNYHNKANLFVKYSFLDGPLKGAFAGLGGMWLSKSPYGLGPSSQAETIPSNRDVSVLLGYNRRIGHYNWRFQVNVANVFNWDYIAIDYYRAPPTNVMVTTAVTF